MTAPRVARLGTFDAERWWRPPDLAELPAFRSDDTAAAAWDEVLAAFCSPGDLFLTRHPMAAAVRDGLADAGITFDHHAVAAASGPAGPPGPLERDVLRDEVALRLVAGCDRVEPYAVGPDTAALSDRLPPVEVVAEVNSKTWSNELARARGLAGAGTVVRSVAELSAAVAAVPAAVVKDPFGVSGRAALVVDRPGVLRAIERTLARQVARGLRVELVVQEKYAVRRDFSAHVHVDADGTARHLGVQVMTNRGLRHLGSGPADRDLLALLAAEDYAASVDAVAAALARAGYHGPAGVDSMLLVDGTLVPVLEVNARQSLGLLSLVLDRTVGGTGLRAHLAQADLGVPPGGGIDQLAAALADVRYTGSGPGVLLLSGSQLAAPGGRVYLAFVCRPDDVTALRHRFADAVVSAGMTTRGAAHAA